MGKLCSEESCVVTGGEKKMSCISPHKEKFTVSLFTWITPLRRVSPEMKMRWGRRQATTGNSALLWMYEHHSTTHARYLLSVFLQCHHRLLQRDSLILYFWYSSKLLSFCSFCCHFFFFARPWRIVQEFFVFFAFGCLLSARGGRHLPDEHAHYYTRRYSCQVHITAFFLCFAIEYNSTVSHCHSLWQ